MALIQTDKPSFLLTGLLHPAKKGRVTASGRVDVSGRIFRLVEGKSVVTRNRIADAAT